MKKKKYNLQIYKKENVHTNTQKGAVQWYCYLYVHEFEYTVFSLKKTKTTKRKLMLVQEFAQEYSINIQVKKRLLQIFLKCITFLHSILLIKRQHKAEGKKNEKKQMCCEHWCAHNISTLIHAQSHLHILCNVSLSINIIYYCIAKIKTTQGI